jgi:hypothetical protein
VGLSDHRPLLVAFSHLPHLHLQDTPRFNKEFGDLKRLQIKRFAPSAPQLQKFQTQLQSTWRPLSATPPTLDQAELQLDHLTQITLAAAPDRKKWKKRNRFKEHWSPTYAALQAQLLAMIKLQRYLGVLPLPPHWKRWSSSLDRTLGVHKVIAELERVVSTLRFQVGIPHEFWGTGLTPSEWRSQTPPI